MTSSFGDLPAILTEIAEVAGLDAAMKIAEAKGGTSAYFPYRAKAGHWLVELVGQEAADKLCAHFRTGLVGGIEVDIPLGPRKFYATCRRRAEELRRQNLSEREIARRLGITYRTIKRYKASGGGDSGQGQLF